MVTAFTPYSTGVEFFGTKPTWIPDDLDIQRIQSYGTYEQMYWNAPDTFKVSLRGANSLPIYIPSAKTIIDATNRFYGVDMRVIPSGPSTSIVAGATLAISDLMKRENFMAKFNGQKRYGLIQGDSLWHITGDPAKPLGSRITMTTIDPGMYFPIPDENDVDKIVGVHLVELITTSDGDRIRRLTYRKVPRPDGSNTITVEEGIFKTDKWGGPDDKPETVIQAPTPLPDDITSIPVYHTKNTDQPGDPFGSSEIRGLEVIMSGVNQAVSDESLALAMMGIGMYATDASHPIDPATGKPVPWQLGPGRVVHHDGTRFDKVPGVSGLADSYGTHYYRLWEAMKWGSGTPDITLGQVDVSVAESGVALALKMSPMLAKAGEKNTLLLGTQTQMWFDILTMWMSAYEQTSFDGLSVDCACSNGMPVDRVQRFAELNDMLDRGVISNDYYRAEAQKLGYTFPAGMDVAAKADFEERNASEFAARLTAETGDGTTGQPITE